MPTYEAFTPAMLKCAVVSGANSATSIVITAIAVEDTLVQVIRRVGGGGGYTASAVLTSEASISSAGNIQLSTTSTAADDLEVWYIDTSAG